MHSVSGTDQQSVAADATEERTGFRIAAKSCCLFERTYRLAGFASVSECLASRPEQPRVQVLVLGAALEVSKDRLESEDRAPGDPPPAQHACEQRPLDRLLPAARTAEHAARTAATEGDHHRAQRVCERGSSERRVDSSTLAACGHESWLSASLVLPGCDCFALSHGLVIGTDPYDLRLGIRVRSTSAKENQVRSCTRSTRRA